MKRRRNEKECVRRWRVVRNANIGMWGDLKVLVAQESQTDGGTLHRS